MAKRQVNRAHISAVESLPAPLSGWNSNTALDAMGPADAIVLQNFFPDVDSVRVRYGYHALTDAAAGAVKTLAEWRGAADRDLIVAGGGSLYTADVGGGTLTSLASGFTSDYWQWVNAGGYLILCNGSDTVKTWEGTTLASSGMTGVTLANLINVDFFKGRLYFVEKDSASMWYGGVGAVVAGALTEFDFSLVASGGGKLMATGSWSQDAGDGKDDLFVAVMDTGEILIYEGDDPGSTFALVGRFQAPPPIGRRCLAKIGGRLVVLTRNGVMPVDVFLQGGTAASLEQDPIWGKTRAALHAAYSTYGSLEGWQLWVSPDADVLHVNVPTDPNTGLTYEQIVLNTVTGAWCKYTDIPSSCWGGLNNEVYCGLSSGEVADHTDYDDDGTDITAVCRTAFQYIGGRGPRKQVVQVRPVVSIGDDLTATLGVNVDFANKTPPTGNITLRAPVADGAVWDLYDWDLGSWAGEPTTAAYRWYSAGGVGNNFSVYLSISTQVYFKWYSTDLLGKMGAGW